MQYHFIGIKGSGMASLALILKDLKADVSGSDIEKFIFTQKVLIERGIQITNFAKSNIKENTTVIIGNAFDESNVEVAQAMSLPSVKVYWYHEFLSQIVNNYCSIGVAGTHGKTTTSGMLAHVMQLHAPCGYLIGDGSGKMPVDSKYFVLESCEYKRHFLAYHPDYAIITNIELDHVDYYHDMSDYCDAFESFVNQVKKGVALFGDDDNIAGLQIHVPHIYYGTREHNDVQAIHIEQNTSGLHFDILFQKKPFGSFKVPYVGKPNLWNSIGVIALGIMEGIDAKTLQTGLESFPGVKRRFTIEEGKENVFIDDYAHHPTAVKYMIEAARIKYPNKKIIAIFKPDRFSRIQHFLARFVEELNLADEVFLCDFPQNAQNEDGIQISINDLQESCKNATVVSENMEGAKVLASRGPAVYLFMSSKDIYKLMNIVKSVQ